LDQCRIRGPAPIRRGQRLIGGDEILGCDNGLRSSPKKVGTAGATGFRNSVQSLDEIVVELYEYFTTCHDHMLLHMVRCHECRSLSFAVQNVAGILRGAERRAWARVIHRLTEPAGTICSHRERACPTAHRSPVDETDAAFGAAPG